MQLRLRPTEAVSKGVLRGDAQGQTEVAARENYRKGNDREERRPWKWISGADVEIESFAKYILRAGFIELSLC